MALERTISIIKPDAVAKNVIGQIYARFENAGLKVVAAKMKHLSRKEAEGFYAVHSQRPFFNALFEFMISGPVMIQVLEGDNAVQKNRDLVVRLLTNEHRFGQRERTEVHTEVGVDASASHDRRHRTPRRGEDR